MRKFIKAVVLLMIGGLIYYGLEFVWRGHSHPLMILVGGVCFLAIGALNECYFTWDMPLIVQAIIGAVITTMIELVSGVILNLILRLNIWNYSQVPLNFLGQICLPYALLWIPLSAFAVVLDDWLRYLLFYEEKPHYF